MSYFRYLISDGTLPTLILNNLLRLDGAPTLDITIYLHWTDCNIKCDDVTILVLKLRLQWWRNGQLSACNGNVAVTYEVTQ